MILKCTDIASTRCLVRNSDLPEDRTPVQQLRDKLDQQPVSKNKGGNVIWVMGMKSLRIDDNRGLAYASELAKSKKSNLIVVFFISPGDWKMHDRSARRVDFVLRNLREMKKQLDELHIPLVVYTELKRTELPNRLMEFAKDWDASEVVGNVEYEVDECWKDIKVIDLAQKHNVHATFVEDAYIIPAGTLKTKDGGRQFSVFSPWNRAWTAHLSANLDLLDEAPKPSANAKDIRTGPLKKLFNLDASKGFGIPEYAPGFECKDVDYMKKLWPAGEKAAKTVLDNFLRRKGGEMGMDTPATGDMWEDVGANDKESRISRYGIGRNLVSENGTSRLSPYLAAGVLSPRACLRATMALEKNKLKVGRGSGTEMWNTEISFRDFYGHVLAAWPRVSMCRAYVMKYEDVVWDKAPDRLEAWKQGRTGFPIVDAAMRQLTHTGWQHNRCRMIVASFLSKLLHLDWRLGEAYFGQNLIDSDLASNNAGWQWSSSSGTDAQPAFRIFNPLTQSEKCDPRGDYLRHWLPELRNVKGAAVHDPVNRLSKAEFEKLGYPRPIIDYKQARETSLRRFKNPGCE